MSFLNSYICPQCNKAFPIFIRPSMRINRGLLPPYLKCPNCGQICRQKVVVTNAFWLWPLTLCFFIIVIYALQTFLYRESLIIYILAVIASLFLVFIGFRRGIKLVKVENEGEATVKNKSYKWLIPAIGLILFSILFGYYTRDWINIVIGVTIGLIAWAFFYHFSGDKKRK